MGQTLPSTFIQKKDLVSHYISTPGWFIPKKKKKKAWQLHKHINLVNFFLKKYIYHLWLSTYSKKRSYFSLLSSNGSHCCQIPCCIPRCIQGLSGDCTSLPLSFLSLIGLVISGGWRRSCGYIISRAWLCPMYSWLSIGAWLCTAYSWVVCMTILGCLQAQAQVQA